MTRHTPFAALTIAALSVLAACDAAPPPTAVDLDHATTAPSTTAALQAAPQGDEVVVVDLAVTGDSRDWWVARSDGTLSAVGSARSLELELDDARLVAITATRDGRALYALTDAAAVHVPSPDRAFPQPSEWYPQPAEWYPQPDEAAGPPRGPDGHGMVVQLGARGHGHHSRWRWRLAARP